MGEWVSAHPLTLEINSNGQFKVDEIITIRLLGRGRLGYKNEAHHDDERAKAARKKGK